MSKINTAFKMIKRFKGPIITGVVTAVTTVMSEIESLKLKNTIADLTERVSKLEKK